MYDTPIKLEDLGKILNEQEMTFAAMIDRLHDLLTQKCTEYGCTKLDTEPIKKVWADERECYRFSICSGSLPARKIEFTVRKNGLIHFDLYKDSNPYNRTIPTWGKITGLALTQHKALIPYIEEWHSDNAILAVSEHFADFLK